MKVAEHTVSLTTDKLLQRAPSADTYISYIPLPRKREGFHGWGTYYYGMSVVTWKPAKRPRRMKRGVGNKGIGEWTKHL
jgi:hypothetical protein